MLLGILQVFRWPIGDMNDGQVSTGGAIRVLAPITSSSGCAAINRVRAPDSRREAHAFVMTRIYSAFVFRSSLLAPVRLLYRAGLLHLGLNMSDRKLHIVPLGRIGRVRHELDGHPLRR